MYTSGRVQSDPLTRVWRSPTPSGESPAEKRANPSRSAPNILIDLKRSLSVPGGDQRHMHQMLAQEPYLQFVGTQDVADRKIVGSVVAQLIGPLR